MISQTQMHRPQQSEGRLETLHRLQVVRNRTDHSAYGHGGEPPNETAPVLIEQCLHRRDQKRHCQTLHHAVQHCPHQELAIAALILRAEYPEEVANHELAFPAASDLPAVLRSIESARLCSIESARLCSIESARLCSIESARL